jgi:hypothetical protein
MADIHVVPDNRRLNLNFQFNSPQQFNYTITLINRERNKQLFRSNGASNGVTNFDLGEADDLIGIYLIIDWTVIDPNGANNVFDGEAIIFQDAGSCLAHQKCLGQTSDGATFMVTVGKFVVDSL